MPTPTDRTKPAWEPIAQARMIADCIHQDLADADRASSRDRRLDWVVAAKARYVALGERLTAAEKELRNGSS